MSSKFLTQMTGWAMTFLSVRGGIAIRHYFRRRRVRSGCFCKETQGTIRGLAEPHPLTSAAMAKESLLTVGGEMNSRVRQGRPFHKRGQIEIPA
jgi:hypothetical protein